MKRSSGRWRHPFGPPYQWMKGEGEGESAGLLSTVEDGGGGVEMVSITVETRSGKTLCTVSVPASGTVGDLKASIAKANKVLAPHRQWLTLPATGDSKKEKKVVLAEGTALADYGLRNGGVVVVKDLGPQVGYSTVFVLEYTGPLLCYLIPYFLPALIYPWADPATHQRRSDVQVAAMAYHTFHYAKRILETLFVHKFSHATMPIFNLVRNCSYYWIAGFFLGYFICHPDYTPVGEAQWKAGFAIALLAQASNFYCHVIQSNLRPKGGKGYVIPRGFLFEYFTCANYTAEVTGWLGFNIATQTLFGYMFMLWGFYTMHAWAVNKHKRLVQLFDGKQGREKYPRRWKIMPFL